MMVFDKFFSSCNFFPIFVQKIFFWLRIRVPNRSGFINSLDLDPDSLETGSETQL